MSSLDEIPSKEVFEAALVTQREAMFDALGSVAVGSDELSALVKAVICGALLERIDTMVGPLMEKWLILRQWKTDPNTSEQRLSTIHTKLYPVYTTSMDAQVPGENIVMLSKQHRPPGVPGERWAALQEGAKVSYLANTPTLAFRLNGLKTLFPNK